MKSMLSTDYSLFMESLQQPSPVSIRINPVKNGQPIGTPIPWTQFGRYLEERPQFTLDPNLHAGAYYVQEASSMLLEQALLQSSDLTKSLRVLDLSAAPGGKSTHLISLLNKDSLLVSNEVIRSRASILSENIQKWGFPNVIVTNNDPKDFQKLEGFFDIILVDAPCSGEGLFRKDPDAMNEWSEDNVQLCAMRQRRILSDVIPSLKEDGILIYSTCTFNDQENTNNLNWLAHETEFDFIPLSLDEDWGIVTIQKEKAIGYQCYPHKVKGEGFFISALRKKNNTHEARVKSKNRFTMASKKIVESLQPWIKPGYDLSFVQHQHLIITIPSQLMADIQFLSEQLNIVTKGIAVAEEKHDKLIPEHAFALSNFINEENFIKLSVSLHDAQHFLKKEPFPLQFNEKGFAIINYQNNSLGWVNLLGNRFNNLYPVNWRIRMNI